MLAQFSLRRLQRYLSIAYPKCFSYVLYMKDLIANELFHKLDMMHR